MGNSAVYSVGERQAILLAPDGTFRREDWGGAIRPTVRAFNRLFDAGVLAKIMAGGYVFW